MFPSLDVFFSPRAVAVVGATEAPGSVGATVFRNLLNKQFAGGVIPVNHKRASVQGVRAYPSITDISSPVDLAVIVTPAVSVPGVMRECAAKGIRGAVIISAGFKETGEAGIQLEHEILRIARAATIRIVGPNCLGVMSPWDGFNATFASTIARPGHVGFISQSGALCTAILDWSLREMVGFSAFLSIGSMLDVGWGDLIDYLGNDPRTHSIILYMESIGDARSFLSAAREVALIKPIIVIKAGRTEAAAKAAASHTGSLSGSDDVLDAAFRRCGVLRVDRISDLFYMTEVLDKQPRPRGPRLAILTNAGGPGVLATDALLSEGGRLAELSPATIRALDEVLPKHWSHQNPVDIIGDADAARYAKAVEIVARDEQSDGLLVVLAPQAMTSPTAIAEQLKPYAKMGQKPILASWMGGSEIAAGEAILNREGIPTFPYPDTAARAYQYMWRYSENLTSLYETPLLAPDPDPAAAAKVKDLIDGARASNRTLLTEFESKQVLSAYGIPVPRTEVAATVDEAVDAARSMGFPVVLKLHSRTITHKTDVGGVVLNLPGESAVRSAFLQIQQAVEAKAGPGHFDGVTVQPMVVRQGYELILGCSLDPQFGPVLLFGTGGQLVEVFRDRALALPPLNTTLAMRMMEQTKIFEALRGVRGRKPVDIEALARLVVRFSELVVENRAIKEIDINPMLASPEGLLALDARVVLHSPESIAQGLPRLAIRPYPSRYISEWKFDDGTPVVIRPIRPEDEPAMVRFHETLSEESVHYRYFTSMKLSHRVSHERLSRICFLDYDREIALVAETSQGIVGVARLARMQGADEAEFAAIISDQFQGRGLGSELMRKLVDVAKGEKIATIMALILPGNSGMQAICRKLGCKLEYSAEDGVIKATLQTGTL